MSLMGNGSRKAALTKTLEDNFVDWEGHVFGFGYGTGEPHTLSALVVLVQIFAPSEQRVHSR